jgi:hypothetical protein
MDPEVDIISWNITTENLLNKEIESYLKTAIVYHIITDILVVIYQKIK